MAGYSLLGATWLILKTEGALQERAYRMAWIAGSAMIFMIGVFSLWTPFLHPEFQERWFSVPSIFYVAVVPLLTAACILGLVRSLSRRRELSPFLFSLGLFLLCFIGLGISIFPNIVPPDITIWQAAAPDESLAFLLVGTSVLLPMIIGYTIYLYRVFWGKVREGESYH